MQGKTRKIVQAVLYEIIAIIMTSPVFAYGFNTSAGSSTLLAVAISTIALSWNMAFNTLFEWWEARQPSPERTLVRRILHAIGFEGGLVVFLVPLMAWWLHISLWQSFLAELGLIALFLVYAFGFQWVFDKVFGVPDSAKPRPATPDANPRN
jgi:uncharacterized membrane protein